MLMFVYYAHTCVPRVAKPYLSQRAVPAPVQSHEDRRPSKQHGAHEYDAEL